MSLTDFFNKFDNGCTPVGHAEFEWTAKGVGFGGMYFYLNKEDGYVHCENEAMSREFLKEMLCQMVDNCVLDCARHEADKYPKGYNPQTIVKHD